MGDMRQWRINNVGFHHDGTGRLRAVETDVISINAKMLPQIIPLLSETARPVSAELHVSSPPYTPLLLRCVCPLQDALLSLPQIPSSQMMAITQYDL